MRILVPVSLGAIATLLIVSLSGRFGKVSDSIHELSCLRQQLSAPQPRENVGDLQLLAAPITTTPSEVPSKATLLYINLDSRPDRRKSIEARLDSLFATRPSAFAGWSQSRLAAMSPTDQTLTAAYTPFVLGTIGCTLSHISALAVAPANDVLFVLEDDAEVGEAPAKVWARLESFFKSRLGSDWDLLLLGYEDANLELEQTEVQGVSRVLSAQTTVGYAVHPRFRRELSEHWRATLTRYPAECSGKDVLGWPWRDCELAIDQVWKVFMRKAIPSTISRQVYAFDPALVAADGSGSSIARSFRRSGARDGSVRCPPVNTNCSCGSWATESGCLGTPDYASCYRVCCGCSEMVTAVASLLGQVTPRLRDEIVNARRTVPKKSMTPGRTHTETQLNYETWDRVDAQLKQLRPFNWKKGRRQPVPKCHN